MAGQSPTLSEIVEQFSISNTQVQSVVHTLADFVRKFSAKIEEYKVRIVEQQNIINLYVQKYGVIDKPVEPGKGKKEIPFQQKKDGKDDKKTT